MSALPSDAASRFTKLCGMLGSDFDGERSNAAAAATALLKQHGCTWADVTVGRVAPVRAPPATSTVFSNKINVILKVFRNRITDWEAEFLESVRFRDGLTPKQQVIWERICRKACIAP